MWKVNTSCLLKNPGQNLKNSKQNKINAFFFYPFQYKCYLWHHIPVYVFCKLALGPTLHILHCESESQLSFAAENIKMYLRRAEAVSLTQASVCNDGLHMNQYLVQLKWKHQRTRVWKQNDFPPSQTGWTFQVASERLKSLTSFENYINKVIQQCKTVNHVQMPQLCNWIEPA